MAYKLNELKYNSNLSTLTLNKMCNGNEIKKIENLSIDQMAPRGQKQPYGGRKTPLIWWQMPSKCLNKQQPQMSCL